MFSAKAYQQAITKAMGKNPQAVAKIKQLRDKWSSARYQDIGEENSIMYPILFMKASPIHTAIITDNLVYFKKHFEPQIAKLALTEACLCGSRNIAAYLLTVLNSNYIEHPDLLAYIAASMNTEWARDVAHTMAEAKIPLPKQIYRLAEGPVIDMIVEIFKPTVDRPSVSSDPLIFSGSRGPDPLNPLFSLASSDSVPAPRKTFKHR